MIVITTDHARHDPEQYTLPGEIRPYWEVPARADALTGEGRGLGWNLNLPLPAGTRDAGFAEAITRGLDAIAGKRPSALIISLGFDAQEGDPAANLAVGAEGFRSAGRQVAALGLPTVLIQEGGYLVERLGINLTAFLSGLGVVR